MAQGDVVFFDTFLSDLCKADDTATNHHFGTTPDTIKCMLITATTAPTTATADSRYGAGGTVNWADTEVLDTGTYTDGGNACASPTVAISGGLVEIDFDNPASWASDPLNDTGVKWGIIYNDTNTNKTAIGFIDLGTAFDMTTGPLTITFGTPVATLNQA